MKTDSRLVMIQTLISLARADGEFAEEERARIRHLVGFLRLDRDQRGVVEAMMQDDAALPDLPDAGDLPDYLQRLYIFQQALVMTYADGIVRADERRFLDAMARRLELTPRDIERAWRRAAEMAEP